MDDLDFDLIMSSFSTITSEINNTFVGVPWDNNLNIYSPIHDINSKLKLFRNFLSIAHLNTVSIPLHKDEIFRVISKANFDIAGFSETNIKKNTPAYLFKFPGYKLFHTDRDGKNCGGVGILIKSELAQKAKKINVNFKESQPEHIFVEVEINKLKILIGVLYKSPSVRYGVFNDILETLAFLTTKYDHCVLMGDFNIDQLKTDSPGFKYFKNNILEPLSLFLK